MDFKQLKYFLATADFGNMTRAAQSVYVAQSAFSQQISNLEDELGARLFDCGKNGMQLTSAGTALYSEVSSTEMTIRLVEQDFGWSVLPWAAIGEAVQRGALYALSLANQTSNRTLVLAYSDSIPLSIAARKALELLRKTIDALVCAGAWHGVYAMRREIAQTQDLQNEQ